eukprot:93255-Prymnesium_polylepis.1
MAAYRARGRLRGGRAAAAPRDHSALGPHRVRAAAHAARRHRRLFPAARLRLPPRRHVRAAPARSQRLARHRRRAQPHHHRRHARAPPRRARAARRRYTSPNVHDIDCA